jgi:hypothetical protein
MFNRALTYVMGIAMANYEMLLQSNSAWERLFDEEDISEKGEEI